MTDERDPKVSQRYREWSREEPSRELDQTILAAAHRSVGKAHAPLVVPAGRHRWYYSLAAAAVLVLAIAVTVQVEHQQPEVEAPVAAPVAKQQVQSRTERPHAHVPEAPPAPAPDAAARRAEENRLALDKAMRAEAEAKAAGARARGDAEAARAAAAPAQYAPLTPERELERIAELRRMGRDEEADKALAEFRKRYPDYAMSQEMRAKVERKAAAAR
jgi:hypothetical protein